jgi:hydroxyethylthiazole kinase
MTTPSSQLTANDLWADVEAVRQQRPLVHSITNLVVMSLNANVLLAAGASPVMAHAHEEVKDMAGIAQALVLNIGTLEPYWVDSMQMALTRALERGIPVVLDPVGAGATPYRNQAVEALLATGSPTVIRGNASEVMSTARVSAKTRGVDSLASAADAQQAALALAGRTGGVVCVTGETDHIFDAQGRQALLRNGHEWMTRITGVGCSLTALVGAFCVVQPDSWRAATSAMALMSVAGEMAAEQAQRAGLGVGTMACALLDHLHVMQRADFLARVKLDVRSA